MTTAFSPSQARVAALLAVRDFRSKFATIWIYALGSAVCVIVALFSTEFHRTFETESVAVLTDPFAGVHAIVLIFLAFVLGMRAATALSWEREHRTMEVLLSGPVTGLALVAAKLLAELATLCALNLVYSAYVGGLRPIGGEASAIAGLAAYWRLSILILPMIGLGLLISACVSTVRMAVIAFLLVVLLLSGLAGATLWLNAQDPNDLTLAALYARGILTIVSDWLSQISPVSYASDLVRFAAEGGAPSGPRLGAAVGLLVVLALAGTVVTGRRGAVS
jgi:ABC-type transport system involved in multi-copper enzyme maturation permease subunit